MKIFPTQDPKYSICVDDKGEAFLVNSVTQKPIPKDCPVMMFLAKDKRAIGVIEGYTYQLSNLKHLEAVRERYQAFEEYAQSHPEMMKEPDTELAKQEKVLPTVE